MADNSMFIFLGLSEKEENLITNVLTDKLQGISVDKGLEEVYEYIHKQTNLFYNCIVLSTPRNPNSHKIVIQRIKVGFDG